MTTMDLSIQASIEELSRWSGLAQKEIDKATWLAINRSIDGARTEADRNIRERYNIKREDVRKVLTIKSYASQSRLQAIMQAQGKRIPVYAFAARPKEPAWRKPVTVSISKAKGRIGKKAWFVARMKSGHVGVFVRENQSVKPTVRLPIKEVMTISVPEMLKGKEVMKLVQDGTRERFDKEFERLLVVFKKRSFT
jgi:hypothetical protein